MKAFNLCNYCDNNIGKNIIIQSGICESDVKCAFCTVQGQYHPFVLQLKKAKHFACRKYIGLSFSEISNIFGTKEISKFSY